MDFFKFVVVNSKAYASKAMKQVFYNKLLRLEYILCIKKYLYNFHNIIKVYISVILSSNTLPSS